MNTLPRQVSRRGLLAAGGMLAAGALVGACSPVGSDPGSRPSAGGRLTAVPAHVPPITIEGAITPRTPGVMTGYTTLPLELVRTVPNPPCNGGELTNFKITWSAPETPLAQNPFWQGLNQRLNTNFLVTTVPSAQYDAKFATMLAGGKLPDVIQVMNTAGARKAIREGAFADLTDDLAGDRILQYPNLANVRPDQWEASAVDGRIFGIPIDIPLVQSQYRIRQDWAKKLGLPAAPSTAEELGTLLEQISKTELVKGKPTWGVTSFPGCIAPIAEAMFHVPNVWRQEGSSLTHKIESDEYQAALEWLAQLWQRGAFHPDALALGTQSAKDLALVGAGQAGVAAISSQNWYIAPYKDWIADGGLVPFVPKKFDGSGPASFARTTGSFGLNSLSAEAAKSDDRRAEMLRVFNYFRAPVGSAEWYFLRYGADGDYFEKRTVPGLPKEVAGNTLATDRGSLAFGCVPQSWIFEGVEEAVDINDQMVRNSIANPAGALSSETQEQSASRLDELTKSYVNDMVTGRKPISALKELRDRWKSQGGDKIREELAAQL